MAAEPYWSDGAVTLMLGDCLDVLAAMEPESVDAVVTDPPYGLAELPAATVLAAIAAWMAGDRTHVPDGRGFMGREWDKFVPPPGAWDECMRVLKPGGHLLAFAGSRTVDLMTLSIRIAGFEVRDSISWLYGSGFPKSLDVSKAIDKAAGVEREVTGMGGRSAVRPSDLTQSRDVSYRYDREFEVTAPATDAARHWEGWGTALKPAHEPIVVARKPLAGTVAANMTAHGTGALNIDGCRVGTPNDLARTRNTALGVMNDDGWQPKRQESDGNPAGRWPPNVLLTHSDCTEGECAPDCPVAELNRQSGVLTSGANPARRGAGNLRDAYGEFAGQRECSPHRGADTGGASRFFPAFRYEAKAPASERPRLEDGTAWPTVKPLALMRWLVRLVTPPGGTVLDPFCGTGTTGQACALEGFSCLLIERDPVAAELAVRRLAKPVQAELPEVTPWPVRSGPASTS
jgi:DNA modification methylase